MEGGRPLYSKIVNNGTPLYVLKEEYGLEKAATFIAMMLSRFCGAFNVSKNMNPVQISDYAITLIEESPRLIDGGISLRLEDLAVFFEIAKTGKYGRPFDYVDAALIDSWLDCYWKERAEALKKAAESLLVEEKKIAPPAKGFDLSEYLKAANDLFSSSEKERAKELQEQERACRISRLKGLWREGKL